jgi:hypothetical protein
MSAGDLHVEVQGRDIIVTPSWHELHGDVFQTCSHVTSHCEA